jgi:hypothetical protein
VRAAVCCPFRPSEQTLTSETSLAVVNGVWSKKVVRNAGLHALSANGLASLDGCEAKPTERFAANDMQEFMPEQL